MSELAEFMEEFEKPYSSAGSWAKLTAKEIPELDEFEDISSAMLEGIYILYLGNEIVYIGQTNIVGKRIGEHMNGYSKGYKNLDHRMYFNRVLFWPCANEAKRLSIETALIKKYNPEHNKLGKVKAKDIRPEYVKPLSMIMAERGRLKVVVNNEVKGVAFGRRF